MIKKPEKLGLVICKNLHTDYPADKKPLYMFIDGDMFEDPPWDFIGSVMKDRVVAVSYGLCEDCKRREHEQTT